MERTLGANVEATITGHLLTIVIDLQTTLGPSKSGKTQLIATTNGNVALPDGSRLGLNVYKPVTA